MTDPDDDLLAELRRIAARVDPVPDDVVAAAKSAIAWRTIDAELLELVDDAPLAGVRGGGDVATLLSFRGPGLAVEIEILVVGRRRRIDGQLVPGQPGRVEVHQRAGRVEVAADEAGRFSAGDLAPGPVSLRCQAPAGHWVETDWFLA
jgi:hypothetical protein